MAEEFKLQDPGEGIHEAEILDVRVSEGDTVEEGDILLEIETDKAAVEIPAPFSGTVESIRVDDGDTVVVGDVLMTYSRDGKADEAGESERDEETPESKKATQRKDDDEQTPESKKATQRKDDDEDGGDHAQRQRKAGKAPDSRQRAQHRRDHGADDSETQERRGAKRRRGDAPVPAAPATRRLARELDVDLGELSGSGPGGRVLAEDVEAAAGEKTEVATERIGGEKRRERERGSTIPSEAPPLPDFSQWGEVERIPLRSIRRATARRMALAWSQIPHVTHQDVADITELEDLRRDMKDQVRERGGDLSLTVLVAKATAAVLHEFPKFNASLDVERDEIILKRHCHIGIAVDTERGLLVPVLRDVDRKTISELAVELAELTEKAKNRKISREALQGGTFTITNPGPLGGTSFTPIIHYPQAAILGMAQARFEPALEGEPDNPQTVARLRLPLMLAFDHRVNDGADAARLLSRLAEVLGDPDSLLLNI
jgi:pyruvate dehydrogenase E2 component (dihydrolipoamide acetyltransferase)